MTHSTFPDQFAFVAKRFRFPLAGSSPFRPARRRASNTSQAQRSAAPPLAHNPRANRLSGSNFGIPRLEAGQATQFAVAA